MSDSQMIVRPSYLPAATEESTQLLQQYAKPAWVRIVQSNTKSPVKPPLKEGDIYLTDTITKVGDQEEPFSFFPMGFFPSWGITNPYGTDPYIRASTLDPASELAKQCKLNIGKTTIIEGVTCKYMSFLNFVVLVPGYSIPFMMSFKGGEYKYGQNFIGLLNSQCNRYKVDPCMLKFRAISALHKYKAPNEGYGFCISAHPEEFATEAEVAFNADLAKKVGELIRNRQLEYIDKEAGEEPAASAEF